MAEKSPHDAMRSVTLERYNDATGEEYLVSMGIASGWALDYRQDMVYTWNAAWDNVPDPARQAFFACLHSNRKKLRRKHALIIDLVTTPNEEQRQNPDWDIFTPLNGRQIWHPYRCSFPIECWPTKDYDAKRRIMLDLIALLSSAKLPSHYMIDRNTFFDIQYHCDLAQAWHTGTMPDKLAAHAAAIDDAIADLEQCRQALKRRQYER